jgi:uncharacterized protein YndB with AHSA1/START domain
MSPVNDSIVEQNGDRVIRISRVFAAPRALVWRALTDPAHMGVWWGPDGFTTTTHKIEVRAGGTWVYTMHGPDGRDYPNAMTFREVVPVERLTYRHGQSEDEDPDADFGTVVTLEEVEGGTRLTMTSTFKDDAARDHVVRHYGAVEGGQQHLEKLSDHLERMARA